MTKKTIRLVSTYETFESIRGAARANGRRLAREPESADVKRDIELLREASKQSLKIIRREECIDGTDYISVFNFTQERQQVKWKAV